MIRRASLLLCAALAAAAWGLAAGPARANGVFPSAEQIVVDPADPSHIVARTTYGLLTTRAAGEPWDWICESAVGYSSGYHPSIGLTADGTVLAGLTTGVSFAPGDSCTWAPAQGLPPGAFVVDLSIEKANPARAVAVTASGSAGPARLWTSDDNGATWAQSGAALPAGFMPLTVDVAPSDPARVYASAQVGTKGSLLVSTDGGATWQPFSVPSTSADHQPYIGAVDPQNADRVYVRTDGIPGRLFVFDRLAATFTELFVGVGLLRGFTLSPDGQTILVGGGSDGVQRAPASAPVFEKVSTVATRCLAWTSAGVYTCAAELADGFTIGLSQDEGATFEPVMHLPCVRGPLACAPGTPVAADCPAEWAAVAIQIGKDRCPDGASTGGSGGSTGSGGASTTSTGGTGGATMSSGAGGAAGGAGGGTPGPAADTGCACAWGREGASGTSVLAGVSGLAALAVLFRRGRRRATPPHPGQ